MSTFLADGIGATLGDSLCLEVGFIGVSSVWYVSSVSGTDASGHGRNRNDPFATIMFAVGFATSGDTIVVLDDHEEETTVATDINKSVVIVGEGSVGGRPSSVWGHNATGSDAVIEVSADNVEIRNIKFTAPQQVFVTDRIQWTGDFGKMKGCYFEADGNEAGGTLLTMGDHILLQSCTWISTAASAASRPARAVATNTAGLTMFRMIGCVVSGGEFGWGDATNSPVMVQQGAGLHVRIEAMSLLLGADIQLSAGGTGFVSVPVATGGGQVRGI